MHHNTLNTLKYIFFLRRGAALSKVPTPYREETLLPIHHPHITPLGAFGGSILAHSALGPSLIHVTF